jgi:hypothetical protein
MKENGHYKVVINYLFPSGRTKNDLLDDINKGKNINGFSYLLGYINLLGPSYKKYGISHWEAYIKKPHILWLKKCEEEYEEYLTFI